jgi:hypothetical protein
MQNLHPGIWRPGFGSAISIRFSGLWRYRALVERMRAQHARFLLRVVH